MTYGDLAELRQFAGITILASLSVNGFTFTDTLLTRCAVGVAWSLEEVVESRLRGALLSCVHWQMHGNLIQFKWVRTIFLKYFLFENGHPYNDSSLLLVEDHTSKEFCPWLCFGTGLPHFRRWGKFFLNVKEPARGWQQRVWSDPQLCNVTIRSVREDMCVDYIYQIMYLRFIYIIFLCFSFHIVRLRAHFASLCHTLPA